MKRRVALLKLHRRRRMRHPFDRGWSSDWQSTLALYWLKNTSRRRHTCPFNKSTKGLARRQARRFVRTMEHTIRT